MIRFQWEKAMPDESKVTFFIRLKPDLKLRIADEAWANRLSMSRWAEEAFEAALNKTCCKHVKAGE